jgi:hypothetical protein
VPDSGSDLTAEDQSSPPVDARPSATVHYIYDPNNPSLNAIISVARRLQEVLIETGAITDGQELPFPALAPTALP